MKAKIVNYKKKDRVNLTSKVSILLKSSMMRMIKTHQINHYKYNKNVINSIIYNEKEQIVAKFKDFLIYDDFSEFMKRFYRMSESITRLPKVNEFYENYSKIFPNYTNIPEAKYMYKNIRRKQKVIDNNQPKNADSVDDQHYRVINTEAYDSIMNQTQKAAEDKMLDVNESVQSLEGIIENISKSEKMVVLMYSTKITDTNFATKLPSNNKDNENTTNIGNSKSIKNSYNFHLNLNGINNKTETKNDLKQSNKNKIEKYNIDNKIQKVDLKMNVGLILSERTSIKKKEVDVVENEVKKKSTRTQKTEQVNTGQCYLKNDIKKDYQNILQSKSLRNSKNLQFTDVLHQDKFSLARQIFTDRANFNDKIIHEEEIVGKVLF